MSNIESDVEIIKPYLTSLGYNFNNISPNDLFTYMIAKKGYLRYLFFGIKRYDGCYLGDFDYKTEATGQIIYDINGNVLLECTKERTGYPEYHCDNDYYVSNNHYMEIDPSNIFMDDIALITRYNGYIKKGYSIFKLENNKYSLIKNVNKPYSYVEKTSKGELFINDMGKLYGVRDLDYLNNLKFKDIFGSGNSLYSINNINQDTISKIQSILNNNNLLFAYDYVENDEYLDRTKTATIFAFLDKKGNIASKIFVKSELEFYLLDADNNTYEEAKEYCINRLNKIVRNEISLERLREAKESKLRSITNEQVLEALSTDFKEEEKLKGYTKIIKPRYR